MNSYGGEGPSTVSAASLVIFGAGHVGKAMAQVARTIGFRVLVVDDRDELNTEARFEGCERVLLEPAEAAERLACTERDWLLVVTHDHRLDEEAVDVFARLPHAYLGVIGSRRKVYRILHRIEARRGLPDLSRVYAPVGIDIGAVTPEEIAVSIASELVALRLDGCAQITDRALAVLADDARFPVLASLRCAGCAEPSRPSKTPCPPSG